MHAWEPAMKKQWWFRGSFTILIDHRLFSACVKILLITMWLLIKSLSPNYCWASLPKCSSALRFRAFYAAYVLAHMIWQEPSYKHNIARKAFPLLLHSIPVCMISRSADWLASQHIQYVAWSSEIMPALFIFIYCWTILTPMWLHIAHFSDGIYDYFQQAAFLSERDRPALKCFFAIENIECCSFSLTCCCLFLSRPSTAGKSFLAFRGGKAVKENRKLANSQWILITSRYDFLESKFNCNFVIKQNQKRASRRFTRWC